VIRCRNSGTRGERKAGLTCLGSKRIQKVFRKEVDKRKMREGLAGGMFQRWSEKESLAGESRKKKGRLN